MTSEQTAQGSLTLYGYDAAGNQSEVEKEHYDAATSSWIVDADTQSTFDSAGRLTMEKQLVSGTPSSGPWVEIDYSNFAASGEPQTTVSKGSRTAAAPRT